jgi:hypothetical protein
MFRLFKHTTTSSTPCSHPGAVPRWDRIEDHGPEDSASRFYCPACDQFISTADALRGRVGAAGQ